MRTIFAEYNPQRNSIDIYFTDVGRCRRFIRVIKITTTRLTGGLL